MIKSIQIGKATLFNGTFEKCISHSPKFDAVLTDPPYGIASIMKGGTWGSTDKIKKMQKWDSKADQKWIDSILSFSVPSIIWGGNYYLVPASRCWLIWDKPSMPTMADCEMAWTNFDRPIKQFKSKRTDNHFASSKHPSQKPVALMKWCLGFLEDQQVILDPFMGSGSTGVAVSLVNKSFIGFEPDKEYFEMACARIKESESLKGNHVVPVNERIGLLF